MPLLRKKKRSSLSGPVPADSPPSYQAVVGEAFAGSSQQTRRRESASVIPHGNRLRRSRPQDAIDPQTGERRYSFNSETSTLLGDERVNDVTEMLHSLSRTLTGDSDNDTLRDFDREPGEPQIASLPPTLWQHIGSFLSLSDAASLAFASKTLRDKLDEIQTWRALTRPENKREKLKLLVHLDNDLPNHILCPNCAIYHIRILNGNEQLKQDYVGNPLFICPKVFTSRLPRTRIAHGRELPFAFAQLATRRKRHHSPAHGILPEALSRRWKCTESKWNHASRFVIVKGHLLMRVISTSPAPPGMMETEERLLLFERNDFTPYFSACAHWKTGQLTKICKCALRHIPEPPERFREQLKQGYSISLSARKRDFTPRQCEYCKDIRRCPECPSEYLVEIKMVEGKTESGRPTFKHALQVTRWSDLGDGRVPELSPEWLSCNGEDPDALGKYDSFGLAGKRTISGTFEAETSNHLFLKRVLSLDPNKAVWKGKKNTNDDWYG